MNQNIAVYRDNKLVRELETFESEKAIRDIHFYYHEQTNWSGISGNLSFGTTFALPYWDYLDIRGFINDDEIDFIRKGSLLILLSMSLEYFEQLGTYFLLDKTKFDLVKRGILSFNSSDRKEQFIQDLIIVLLKKIENQEVALSREVEQKLIELNVTEIYGFYRGRYHLFDKHYEKLYLKYTKGNAH